ncbi:hypothetical protein N8487_00520 [bacterium]|jgi:hypothetical protein|nr:hypothetical protein [bacterium]
MPFVTLLFKNSTRAVSQQSSYDPAKDTPTIETDGYTWQLKGKVTNVVVTPKPSQ